MYEMKQLKTKNQMLGLRAVAHNFAEAINKKIDWKHWHSAVGGLVNNNIADCLVIVHENEFVGALIWSYFPDLITAELSATEIGWYVEPLHRGCGIDLLDKMIEICQSKGVKYVNMTHFTDSRIGVVYERKGFKKYEISYVKAL
jgi:GNAT superfamily N-acetyltransferase